MLTKLLLVAMFAAAFFSAVLIGDLLLFKECSVIYGWILNFNLGSL